MLPICCLHNAPFFPNLSVGMARPPVASVCLCLTVLCGCPPCIGKHFRERAKQVPGKNVEWEALEDVIGQRILSLFQSVCMSFECVNGGTS